MKCRRRLGIHRITDRNSLPIYNKLTVKQLIAVKCKKNSTQIFFNDEANSSVNKY